MGQAIVAAIPALAGTATGVVVAAAINIVIASILGKLLAPNVPKSGRGNRAITSVVRNPILSRRIAYGEAVTGGPYIYLETGTDRFDFSADNEILHMVIAISGHPIDDIIGIFIGDEYIDISGSTIGQSDDSLDNNYYVISGRFSDPIAEGAVRIVKNNGWGYADFQYVTDETKTWSVDDRTNSLKIQDFTYDFRAAGGSGASLSRDSGTGLWEATGHADPFFDKLTNCSHIYIALEHLPDVWSGIPRIKFHIKGKRLYNPALDPNLVAYGADSSGTHDLNDPDTWEYSSDWTLCCLDYLINSSYGLGAKASTTNINDISKNEIDWGEVISSYNTSSELITNAYDSPYTGTEPRYTINGIIQTSSTPISIMETLLASGAGELIYSQGLYKIRPGIYREPASEADIINEDMILSNLTIQTHTPRSELFNKVAGIYIEPYDNKFEVFNPETNVPVFEASDFPMVDPKDSSGLNPYEVIDGEEIIADVDYPLTTSSTLAQRLARIQLERVRRGFSVSFEATLEVLEYSTGDIVYLEILSDSKYIGEDFYNRLGLDDQVQLQDSPKTSPYYKQFKIISMDYTENFTIMVTLLEESQTVYDWNDGDAITDDTGALISDIPVDDPVGIVQPPSFVVTSPATTIVETTVSTDIRTEVYWSAPDRGSTINEIDRLHIRSYQLQYGIVDNPSQPLKKDRVSTWIPAPSFSVTDFASITQGPIAVTNIYIDPNTDYDIRLRSVTTGGRRSAWAYYSIDIGSDFTPSIPFGSSRYYIKETNGQTIHNSTGTLTIEAREVTSAGDNLLSSGTIRLYETVSPYNEITTANGYVSPSDGFTGIFDSGDINSDIVVGLFDGTPPGGTLLDTTTLTDITDGADGSGQGIRTVNMYKLNDSTVGAPSAGTFADPLSGQEAGWSLSVPALTADGDIVYVSTRTFTDDAQSPQDPSWSATSIYAQRTDGTGAITGFIEPENGLAWTRAPNSGSWTPSQATTDLDCTFTKAGANVAKIARRVTLNTTDGTLNVSTVAHKDGDLNTGDVTVTVTGSGTTSVTVQFDYLLSPDAASVAETVKSVLGGDDGGTGATGQAVRTVNIYKLNDSTVGAPSAGTFADPLNGQEAGWSLSVPDLTADGDIVYVSTRTFTDDAASPQDPSWSATSVYAERIDGKVGWTQDLTFSVTSPTDVTVSWTSGTITLVDGSSFSVPAGDTTSTIISPYVDISDSPLRRWYIYFDSDVGSPYNLITTDVATEAVGNNKILIAVAEARADQTEPFFQVFGGAGGIKIAGEEVAANSIVANNIAASFFTGRQFTGGIFQTRDPNDSSPYPGTPRAVLQEDDPQIAVYSNDGASADVEIFGITDIGGGQAEITLKGDFLSGSLDTAQMYSAAGIVDLRGRLGTTLPSNPTGGINTRALPTSLVAASTDYDLDVDRYNTNLTENSFTFTIKDSGLRKGPTSNPYTAPVWDINFFYTDDLASPITWTQVPSADWTVTGTTSDIFIEDIEPPEWQNRFNLSATRSIAWTPGSPFVSGDPIYYMIRIEKTAGDHNLPKLEGCSVSEAIQGGTVQNLPDLGDVDLVSLADGDLLLYDTGNSDWHNAAMSGDATIADTGVLTVADEAITLPKMAHIATDSFLGRDTAGTGDVEVLTGTVATSLLNVFTSGLKGLAPSSGGGTTNFLRADGTWAAPPGGGSQTPWTSDIDGANFGLDNIDRLEIQASGVATDTATFTHDGTDFNTVFVNTTDWNIYDNTTIRLNRRANATTSLIVGEPTTARGDSQDSQFVLYGEQSSTIRNASFINTGSNLQVTGAAGLGFQINLGTQVLGGNTFRLMDSTNADSAQFDHDGTDFNTTFVTTTDWNISGITSIQAGTVNADFDAITATSYGGITEANLLDKTATEIITGTWTLDGPVTTADFGTGGRVKDGTDVSRPVGFNVLPVYEVDTNDTFDLAHSGMLWHKDAGSVTTFTCAQDANVPQGATYVVHNDDTEDLTITATSPALLYWLVAGAAPTEGDIILKQGALITLYKYSDTEFWAWGTKEGGAAGTLAGLSDTNITTPADAALLLYDTGTGDWQDATMSGDATIIDTGALTIANDAITYAKMQNVAADDRILGNVSGTGQIVAELDASTVRTMINVADGANNYSHPNHTGDVTSVGDGAQTIAANAVSNTKLRDSVALSVIGRSANSTGDPADIAAASDGQILRRSGTSIGFGNIVESAITDGTILARLASDETITGTWTLDGPVTTSDFGTGGRVKDGGDTAQPIGFNVMPVYEIDVDDDLDLAHNGMIWHKDVTTVGVDFTAPHDTNIPIGATYVVANDGNSTLEVNSGANSTLRWMDGSGDSALPTGARTIAHGGVATIIKIQEPSGTSSVWLIWGSGIT